MLEEQDEEAEEKQEEIAQFDGFLMRQFVALPGVIQVSCGAAFTLALTLEGKVYSWGQGMHGCLGNGVLGVQREPRRVNIEQSIFVVFISAGTHHAAALSSTNDLYTWGDGQYVRRFIDELRF